MSAVGQSLRRRMERDGPVPFIAWMEAALYGPDGYYQRPSRKTGAGRDADFATSPTLHPFFAHSMAAEIRAIWRRLGRPAGFSVAEFGGGEGDLARQALAFLDANQPDLSLAMPWLQIERSARHRALQLGADERIQPATNLPEGFMGVVVANEFLDALPFHWLERTSDGWMELHVGLENDRFVLVPESPDAAAAEVASQWYTWVPVGQRVPVMLGMREWLAGMPGLQGAVLIADYGGPDAWKTSRDGSVRAYAAHDHANVLAEPGSVDLTASIDTTLLHAWAEEAGWTVACHETQEAFLLRHDILSAINRADRTTKEGASAYLRMRQLLLPTGMGAAFRFLRLERDVPPDLRGPPHDA